MLWISDQTLINYYEADEKFHLEQLINKKRFTVADTPLSYRQVNSLDSDNLLSKDRAKKSEWHKFSLKEMVYVLIVAELKKFGVKHEQMIDLWKAFFGEIRKDRKQGPAFNKHISDIAIGCVFGQIEIKVTISAEGELNFYDPGHYTFLKELLPKPKAEIVLTLNDFVNELLEKTGKKPFPTKYNQLDAIRDRGLPSSPKEIDLLAIIRNKDYSAVKVTKKDGEIAIVYAERYETKSDATPKDILKLIDQSDYQNISLIKRDGRIVNYKVEETIKL